MFPHIAYPHAHDMEQLWPYVNRMWAKDGDKLRNCDRINFTPFRQIGLTNELIETDYRRTLINLAKRLDNCILSNHLDGKTAGVHVFHFEFDHQKRLRIINF